MTRKHRLLPASLLVGTLLLAGCASPHPATPQDPYESFNRSMYLFNDAADRWVMKPAAQGYRAVTPGPFRTAVGNFFDNFKDVYSAANNLLQAEPEKALNDIMRVALNSTFGLFGLIDIATPAGLKNNKTSLGDTFAHWGWKSSNYLVLPFFGPSTVRDGLGLGVSLGINGPEHLVYHNTNEAVAFYGVYGINTRARYLDLDDSLSAAAIDPYTYMRDGFLQLRARQLGQPNPTQNDDMNIDDLVSSPAAASAPAAEAAPAASANSHAEASAAAHAAASAAQ
ncbi:MlaA family lipoprotein [Aquitalea aquatilis]|uniref:MlaA family lipoprotein n=1 Tax=Aquitalea aquatilis TaxID=1537400 RepID=UPI001FEC5EF5|nr:VacJ family lipoprotein [Aquitalea aquatilis]